MTSLEARDIIVEGQGVHVLDPEMSGWTWQPHLWGGARAIALLELALEQRWNFVPNVVVSLWDGPASSLEMWGTDDLDRMGAHDVLLGEARFQGPGGAIRERMTSSPMADGDACLQLVVWHQGPDGRRRLQVAGSVLASQSSATAQVWDLVRTIGLSSEEEQ